MEASPRLVLLGLLFAGAGCSPVEAETWCFEAESFGRTLSRFRDVSASGEACVAASLAAPSGTLLALETPSEFQPGFYRIRFYLRLTTLSSKVNTGLSIQLRCGGVSRQVWQGQFLAPEQYTPLDVLVDHASPAFLSVSVSWGQVSAKDFFEKAFDQEIARVVRVSDTRVELTRTGEEKDEGLDADKDDEALVELQGGGDLAQLIQPVLALDRVEVTLVQGVAHTADIQTNKVRYEPGEEGRAAIRIRNYQAQPAPLTVRASLVRELDERQDVWEGKVELAAHEVKALDLAFNVGPDCFGRALRLELLREGQIVDVSEQVFGVAPGCYQISVWGSGPGQDNWRMQDSQLEAIVAGNHHDYANIYEFFSWAPCDFWEQSPEDSEDWYSGQTQYHCGKRSIRRFHDLCHEQGIQAASYYQAAAKPRAGLEALLQFPEWFSQGAIGIGFWHVDVDALERMVRNDYEGERRLRSYQPMGINANLEAVVRHGGEELVRSAEMLGWDAVRYDGHFTGWGEDADAITAWNDQLVRSIVSAKLPKYQFGYNAGTTSLSTAETYDRADALNFVQMCSGGGLIMNEAFRDHPNRNFSAAVIDEYVRWVSVEARATRRAGGYHLGFFFDRASPSDHAYNAAIELASGSRPLGYGWQSPAEYWRPFVTRYSAYYWDNELFEIRDARERVKIDSPSPVWFEPFCYRRPRGPGRGQYVVHLIAKPLYASWNDLLQPPAPVMKNVRVSLQPDEGWNISSAWTLTPSEPEATGPIRIEKQGTRAEALLPSLTLFASVVFNTEGPAGVEWPVPRLPPPPETDPLKAAWHKVQALRDQGYLSPVPDEQRAREWKSIERVLARQAGASNPPPPSTVDPLGFRQVPMKETLPTPPGLDRPRDMSLRRNGLLDVRIARGVFNWMLRLDEALGRAGGAALQTSFLKVAAPWADPVGQLTDVPWSTDELLSTDIVVLNNIGPSHLDSASQHRLRDFVAQGGGLLVLGGYWTLGKGGFRDSPLEDLLPVNLFAGDPLHEISPATDPQDPSRGLALLPTAQAPESVRQLPWLVRPAVRQAHHVQEKTDAQVWVRAGTRPLLVTGSFGKGRVAVWAGTVHGRFRMEETPFWEWHGWPLLISETLLWLGNQHEETYQPAPDSISEEQVVEALEQLAGEETAEAAKRLALLCEKADPDASAFLLTAHGDSVELSEDQIVQLVDRIRPGTDGLVDTARRFLESQQPPVLAAGVRLLGLSGDKSLETEVLQYLDSGLTEVQTGSALALADIGSARSLDPLRRKSLDMEKRDLKLEEDRWLHHRVLLARHRLGDASVTGKLAEACLFSHKASENSWREWALLMEQAGTAFKKTAREYAAWQMAMRRALLAQARWIKEYHYLASALRHLPEGSTPALARSLAQVTDPLALGLLHQVLVHADAKTLRELLPLMDARMPALAGSLASKARLFPELEPSLNDALERLARSDSPEKRRFAAAYSDLLPDTRRRELLQGLAQDGQKDVRLAAQRALDAMPKP
ncbi:MAG: hypothetical protein HYU36_02150 [Planctomycetes bacterium]|nr:hypothetical protein [Planctomycetota bacterium]